MRYSIKSTEGGCTMTVADHHTASDFPVPMMAGDLTALLASLLADPDRSQVESGSVLIARTKEGVSIQTRGGAFGIPYAHLFAIQGIPA
jgi:hypothetical protein